MNLRNPKPMPAEMGSLRGNELLCICGCRFLLTCYRDGELDVSGPCLMCWECRRILTRDGVVIGRESVSA